MNNVTINLLNETTDLFRSAVALLEYRHQLAIMQDEIPSGYSVNAQEYKDGIPFIKSNIIGNKFVNSESRGIVRDAIVAYRKILPVEHKMTAKRIDRFLDFIDAPKACELAEARS